MKMTKEELKTIIGRKVVRKKESQIELHYRKKGENFLLEEPEVKIDPKAMRRILVDSVHSANKYRLLVAKYQTKKPIEELINTRNWNSEYSIMVYREEVPSKTKKGKPQLKERIDREDPDTHLKTIPLTKEEIVEGTVYIIIGGFKFDVTNEARETAKWQYENLLQRE